MKNRVLVVDDEPGIRETVSDILNDYGYETLTAADGEEAEKKILIEDLDVVILDVLLPKKGGLDLLEVLSRDFPVLPVIVISGHGNIKMAVDAMKRGGFDFIEKPLSMERIIGSVRNAIKMKNLQTENISLKSRLEKKPVKFLGSSPVIQGILEQIPNIATSDATVLVTGDNGTGKEVLSQIIHAESHRKNNAFVSVNCAAIPDTLIESELFGHEKGAFTGAVKQKKGKFETANGGTIFLDEIGDLSLSAQAKVLRVLQEKEFTRVGGNELVKVDVRVIAATNRNLMEMSKNETFRQDLFYRLNVVPIHIPALRERKEDIQELVDHFLDLNAEKTGKRVVLKKSGIQLLKKRNWPGNVRELQNFIERVVILSNKNEIEAEDILKVSFPEESNVDESFQNVTLKEAKRRFEKKLIIDRLIQLHMNITKTAESLGLERTYLHKKIKELEIDREVDVQD